jgi:hypothetical protein
VILRNTKDDCFVEGSTVFSAWELVYKLSTPVGTNKETHRIICARNGHN